MSDIDKPTQDVSLFSSDGTIAADVYYDSVTGKNRVAVDANITAVQPVGVSESETIAIRKGWAYSVASQSPITILAGATYNIHLKTQSATRIHLRDISFNVNKNNLSGTQTVALYGDATVSVNGTAQTPFNNDRAVTTPTNLLVYTNSTVTAFGTKFYEYILHSDWETYVQPSYTTKYELIMKKNTNYILQVSNNQNQPITLTWFLFYYELEPY